jgi:hypothetical protein
MPYEVGWARLHGQGYDVAVSGNRAYVGCYDFRVFDVSDPTNPVLVGQYTTPGRVRRVRYRDGLVYAACLNAGVCIFETTSTGGFAEGGPPAPRAARLVVTPNPASSFVDIRLEVKQTTNAGNTVRFFNAVGRVVLDVPCVTDRGQQPCSQRVDISALPEGCYFVAVEPAGQGKLQKVIKAGKRR